MATIRTPEQLTQFALSGAEDTVAVPYLQHGSRYYAKINGQTYSAVASRSDTAELLSLTEEGETPEVPVLPETPEVPDIPVIEPAYVELDFGPVCIRMDVEAPVDNATATVTGTAGTTVILYDENPQSVAYVRGLGLIAAVADGKPTYYHYNAHGDVVQLTDSTGALIKDYTYDAFGVEQNADEDDTNAFRYCGEQYDTETGNYYLRARYYTPGVGRFTQEDTHWNPGNMVYGDDPQKWNEYQSWLDESDRDDPLGLHTYTYKPEATAVAQSGNAYVYSVGNPVLYVDKNGEWVHIVIGAAIGGVAGGLINAWSQKMQNGKVDWGEVAINAAGGAVGGALTAAGLGPGAAIAASAITAGGTNALVQAYRNNWDFRKINVTSVLTDAAIGAFAAKAGGSAGNSKHLDNAGKQLMTRIGKTLGGKTFTSQSARRAAAEEVMKALRYYASQSNKDNLRVMQSVLKSQLPWLAKMGYDVYSVKAGK